MLLVIHGSEPYLVHRKLRQAVEKARAQHASGVRELDAEASLKDADEALRGGSLFEERTVTVFRDWFREKPAEDANRLAELLEGVPGDGVAIVAEAGEVDKRRKAFAKLAASADKAWHYPAFDEPTAAGWLVKRAEAAGTPLSPALARHIVTVLGTDGWTLATELDKLSAASQGPIEEDSVKALTDASQPATIWQLVDAVAARDFPKAQHALRSLLAAGEPAQRIFAMVVRQYRILLAVRSAENRPDAAIGKTLGVHPYSVRQARRQAGRFTEAELRTIFDELSALDLATKSGKRDATEALEFFVAEHTVAT